MTRAVMVGGPFDGEELEYDDTKLYEVIGEIHFGTAVEGRMTDESTVVVTYQASSAIDWAGRRVFNVKDER